MSEWINWARTESSTPSKTVIASSEADVRQAVLEALETGQTIKPIGASHSFTAIGATDGIRLDMSQLRGLVSHDAERQRVTLWAGTHLWELPGILDPLGLALANMGDIDAQTIAGATQTGTHGTGLKLGGLATTITGVTMIDGEANLVTVDETQPELLRAVALSLGALGVFVTVTLQCVPRYILQATEEPAELRWVLDHYTELVETADHYEFFWFPHTKKVRTKTNTRLPATADLKPLSKLGRWLDEEFVNNDLLGAVLAFEHKFAGAVPRVNKMIESVSSRRTYTDWSYRVFVTKRRVRFKESEFAVPLAAVPQVMADIAQMIERKKFKISFPIEVRNASADNLMLSTAQGRESGYIAVHRYYKDDEREYFKEVWAIMRAYDGRPHWGKMHNLNAAQLSDSYDSFGDFLTVRDNLDPNRLFANSYLERVLGK